MPLKPGVYIVRNIKSGTVLDMDAVNKRDLMGQGFHGGVNQQWAFIKSGKWWFIKCMDTGGFLNIEGGLDNGTRIIMHTCPAVWDIKNACEEGDDVFRIMWPNSNFAVDLHEGSSANGTKVHIYKDTWYPPQQLWRLQCLQHLDEGNEEEPESTSVATTMTTTTTTTTTATSVMTVTATTFLTRRNVDAVVDQ